MRGRSRLSNIFFSHEFKSYKQHAPHSDPGNVDAEPEQKPEDEVPTNSKTLGISEVLYKMNENWKRKLQIAKKHRKMYKKFMVSRSYM